MKLTWSLWILFIASSSLFILNLMIIGSNSINWENYGKLVILLITLPLPFMFLDLISQYEVKKLK